MENRHLKENKMLPICFSSYDKCLLFLMCNIRLKFDFLCTTPAWFYLNPPKKTLRILFIYTLVMMGCTNQFLVNLMIQRYILIMHVLDD